MNRLYVFLPLFWGVSLYALLRGGRDERAVAIIYAIGVIISPLVARPEAQLLFNGVERGLLAVDCTLFVAIAIVALRSNKFWPLWATWLLGIVLIAHLAPLLGTSISRLVYAQAEKLWSYPLLILLGAATWRHRQQLASRPGPTA